MKKDITGPIEKFKLYADDASLQFKEKIIAAWTESFCVLPEERSSLGISEHVLRCRKVKSKNHDEFVQTWFKHNHGVNAEVAEMTLGGF